ncbi:MAG TPA: NADH-ubiquinone oxidoreductase-F iron-sulfur binding region domain-containing protein [Solirubrobacteraceae bacterium]|nr:NADH-ubiquinone oxidoreductase-F iron-sulfur binding region domain-containing protein [Solirubrobacteraceae bacterium]
MSASSPTAELPVPTSADPPAALPRLLAGIHGERPLTLSEHLDQHGEAPPAGGGGRSRSRARARELIEEVEASGLRGCGGGGFPTAVKLRSVAAARGRAVVVVNAVEAEPPSTKDRTLLQLAPHLVLDGAILAAEALRADEVVVATGEHAGGSSAAAYAAIEERAAVGGHGRVALTLAAVKGGYVAGQESALISGLEGREALPTFTPPLPFERGLHKRPTLVNNAETLAHLALIARHGARWFRTLGTEAHPGSALVTLSGPVVYPGVYEIEAGSSLSSLIDAAGGTTRGVRGALTGGYAGSWVPASAITELVLSRDGLPAAGGSFGAGIVLLLSDDACPVAETVRLSRWLAGQSARQCGPCVHGLPAIADALAALASGEHRDGSERRLRTLFGLASGRGACAHPDGAVRVIASALRAFTEDFEDHRLNGPCERCSRAGELPLPPRPGPSREARGARRAGP